MSQKLTNDQRHRIIKQLLHNKFAEQEKANKEAQQKLALDIYKNKFAKDLRRMNGLPDGWLATVTRIQASFFGCGEFSSELPKDVSVRVPFTYSNYGSSVSKSLGTWQSASPLAQRCLKLQSSINSIRAERDRLDREMRSALWGFGTVTALLKGWLEITDLVHQICRPENAFPIVKVDVSKLNEQLGLKPVEKPAN